MSVKGFNGLLSNSGLWFPFYCWGWNRYKWFEFIEIKAPFLWSLSWSYLNKQNRFGPHLIVLTSKTFNSLKSQSCHLKTNGAATPVTCSLCTCVFCVKSTWSLWGGVITQSALYRNATVTNSSTRGSEGSFEFNTSKWWYWYCTISSVVWHHAPPISCDSVTCNVMSSKGKLEGELSICHHPEERKKSPPKLDPNLKIHYSYSSLDWQVSGVWVKFVHPIHSIVIFGWTVPLRFFFVSDYFTHLIQQRYSGNCKKRTLVHTTR